MSFKITFALIKPESVAHPFICWAILSKIFDSNLSVLAAKTCHVSRSEAEKFYNVHKEKFFYNRLVGHMTSGPTLALLLGGSNAVERWRQILGPTKVFKSVFDARDSLRGQFGLTDTRNVAHGSDSSESAVAEANYFFPEFCDIEKLIFHQKLPSFGLSREEVLKLIFPGGVDETFSDESSSRII